MSGASASAAPPLMTSAPTSHTSNAIVVDFLATKKVRQKTACAQNVAKLLIICQKKYLCSTKDLKRKDGEGNLRKRCWQYLVAMPTTT